MAHHAPIAHQIVTDATNEINMQTVGASLTEFFQGKAQRIEAERDFEHQQTLIKEEKKVQELDANRHQAVEENRAKARIAASTGEGLDLFVPPEHQTREGVMRRFQKHAGSVSAIEAQDEIRQMVTDGASTEELDKYFQEQTKGADPFFAKSFNSAGREFADKLVHARGQTERKAAAIKTREEAMGVARERLTSETFTPTNESVGALRGELAGMFMATGMNAVEAEFEANAVMDQNMAMAAVENPSLTKLLTRKDPARGDTSFEMRHPNLYQQTLLQQSKFAMLPKTKEAIESARVLSDRLSTIGTPLAAEDDTLEALEADIAAYGQAHGQDANYYNMRKTLASKFGQEATNFAGLEWADANATRHPGMDDTDWDETSNQILNLAQQKRATNGHLSAVARSGYGTDGRQRLTAMIGNGGDDELFALQHAAQLKKANPNAQMSDFFNGDTAEYASAVNDLVESGQMGWEEARQAMKSDTPGEIDGHYQNERLREPGRTGLRRARAGTTMGMRGVNTAMNEMHDNITGGDGTDFKNLPQDVRDLYARNLDLASFALRGKPASDEEIIGMATRLSENQVSHNLTADGIETSLNNTGTDEGFDDVEASQDRFMAERERFGAMDALVPSSASQDHLTKLGFGMQLGDEQGAYRVTPGKWVAFKPGEQPPGLELIATEKREIIPGSGVFEYKIKETGQTTAGEADGRRPDMRTQVQVPGLKGTYLVLVEGQWRWRYSDYEEKVSIESIQERREKADAEWEAEKRRQEDDVLPFLLQGGGDIGHQTERPRRKAPFKGKKQKPFPETDFEFGDGGGS